MTARGWSRNWIVGLIVVCFITPVCGQDDADSEAAPHERIVREALSRRGTYRLLEELCERAPRRLSGSAAAAAAVEWGRRTLAESGLDVRLEPVMVPHWVRGDPEVLSFAAPAGLAGQRLPVLALGGSVATPDGGITAPVVTVTSFEELAEKDVEGKIVLFNRPMSATLVDPFDAYRNAVVQRVRGAVEAAKAGGVAAIVRSMTPAIDDVPHTGGMQYQPGVPRIPTAAVSTRGAERIAALLRAGKEVRLHLEMNCEWKEDAPSFNVVADLRGREKPEEIVLVCGHLDSWDVGQGAHDDGAGVCQAIQAVRLIRDLGLTPRRTLRVVLYMNEENGLAGARQYAKVHAEELGNHVLALESDRGGFTPRGFTTNANPDALAILTEIAKPLDAIGAAMVRRGGGGADIGPLGPSGVVLVGFLPDAQRYFDYHHTPIDTIDKVNERELELGTAAIATLVHAVADAKGTIPRNPKRK